MRVLDLDYTTNLVASFDTQAYILAGTSGRKYPRTQCSSHPLQVLYTALLPAYTYTLAYTVLQHSFDPSVLVLLVLTGLVCAANVVVGKAVAGRFAAYHHDAVRSGMSVARALSGNKVGGVMSKTTSWMG